MFVFQLRPGQVSNDPQLVKQVNQIVDTVVRTLSSSHAIGTYLNQCISGIQSNTPFQALHRADALVNALDQLQREVVAQHNGTHIPNASRELIAAATRAAARFGRNASTHEVDLLNASIQNIGSARERLGPLFANNE